MIKLKEQMLPMPTLQSRQSKQSVETAKEVQRRLQLHVGRKKLLPHDTCVCGKEYSEVTDEIESWIGCDVGVDPTSIPSSFICAKCSRN